MAQFQIPQFIEVENKIVGPLSLKQFLYLAGAGMICFALYFVLQFWLWLMIAAVLGSAAVALAFIKYNGRPLPRVAWAAFIFFWKPRFYLWKRVSEEKTISIQEKRKSLDDLFPVKKLWQDLMTTTLPLAKREKGATWRFQEFRKITGEKEVTKRVDYR